MLAKEHNIPLILDETYRDLVVSESPHSLFTPLADFSWRKHVIHLFSFSKSYCIPGLRLGAIVASPELLFHINTILDCLQICAPRPVQLGLAPILPLIRPFINDMAAAVKNRHALFKRIVPPKWKIGSQGGYFAFVRHPFSDVNSSDVCARLAKELGVITLPSAFFCEDSSGENESWDKTRWMRFSLGNVSDEQVEQACQRLCEAENKFGWALEEDLTDGHISKSHL